jgi:hypothetical protein
MMVMVKTTKDSEAAVMPDTKLLTEMGKYNEAGRAPSQHLRGEEVSAQCRR